MKLSLEISTKQQLSISPQLQQAIRLLQLSSLELQAEIQQTVERNPLLEMDEPEGTEVIDHPLSMDNLTTGSNTRSSAQAFDYDDPYYNTHDFESLSDHLTRQLYLSNLSPTEQLIGITLIDAITPDGYLYTVLEDLQTTLAQQNLAVPTSQIEATLSTIQSFEPAGVGARSIEECILLQLHKMPQDDETTQIATHIINHYFEPFSQRELSKILRAEAWTQQQLLDAAQLIMSVNPRPGAHFTQLPQHYVIPDVFVRNNNGTWQVFLNPNTNPLPKLNPHYLALIGKTQHKKDSQYLKDNLKEAKWFISSIENRNTTLIKVAKAIMDYQMAFLEQGELAMKPLRLLTIADTVELHESTISRVTTQKYIHTPHGIFELKHFFSSQLSSDSGDACSSTAIKAHIKKLIDQENKYKPYSDNMIAKLLKNDGINVARRTITKYREAMNIASSTDRKKLYRPQLSLET